MVYWEAIQISVLPQCTFSSGIPQTQGVPETFVPLWLVQLATKKKHGNIQSQKYVHIYFCKNPSVKRHTGY